MSSSALGGFARCLRACANDPAVLVDVGAAGGIDDRWGRMGAPVSVVAIDSREGACQKSSGSQSLNAVVAGECAPVRLHLARKQQLSSLLLPNRQVIDLFPEGDRFDITSSLACKATTLDVLLEEHDVRESDFLKIDTQGCELSILEGARRTVGKACLVEVEVAFVPLYCDQPLFCDVHTFLCDHGFELFDLNRVYWKRQAGRNLHGRGQLIFADALYLRRPDLLPITNGGSRRALEVATLGALAFGYYDYALTLWESVAADDVEDHGVAIAALKKLGAPSVLSRIPGSGVAALALREFAEMLRGSTWACADQRLGNTRK